MSPDIETRTDGRNDELFELAEKLAAVYHAQGCVIWLLSAHSLLEGRSAAEVWTAGERDRVLAVVDGLVTGAFG